MTIPPRLEPLLAPGSVPVRVAERFREEGHEIFLVGGGVRDALLDRTRTETDDFDFATAAPPEEIHRVMEGIAHSVVTVGKEFGTVGGVVGDAFVEVTTFRSEIYRDDSRKPVVEFSDDLAEDLSRRDFTVNALALRVVPEPEVIDPHGGLVDLAQQVLRTPLDPSVSFGDDPLRMLRLFRFVSSLGFEPDAAALQAVREMGDRLEIVSAERIRDELDRLIAGEHVEVALWGLVETGLADHFLPELPGLALEADPQHHHKDVLAHTIAVVGKVPADDRITRLAALFHDIGKPDTREFGEGGVSFHHHEVVGARMTKGRMKALRYPKSEVDDVSDLVYLHMRPHTYVLGWTDRAVRRYVRDAGPLLDRLNLLVRCDVTTANEKRARQIQNRIDELEERIADLRQREEIDAIRPPIDGNRVMEVLGIPPGPVVGEAMHMLLEHRLDEGPYSPEEAEQLLRAWWGERANGE